MSKIIKKKSQKQESKVANDLNGRVTIASGALYFQKADVRTDKFLVECKFTDKAFYSLTLKTWEKVREEAIKDGLRIPVMQIDINGDAYSYAVMDLNDFYMLLDENTKFTGLLCDEIKTDKKSFRVTKDIVINSISIKHITYTTVSIGKHHLAVFHWEDMKYLNN